MPTNLEKSLTTARKLTSLDPDMTLQQLRVLLEVAVGDGSATAKVIAERMEVAQPTVSRALDLWGAYGSGDKPGRNFCERVEDPDDRRFKPLRITRAGKSFLNEILFLSR